MIVTLKNRMGSPFDIQTANGPAILPAFGELPDVDMADAELEMIRTAGHIEAIEAEPEPDKPDEDEKPKPKKKPAK